MKKSSYISSMMALLMTAGFTSIAHAKSVEGVIKGAECHLYGKFCSADKDDPKPRFEKDFVLVTGGNEYYVLEDLPLKQKRQLNNQTVRVSGEIDNHSIAVNQVKAKDMHGRYKNVWDWDQISFELYEN